VANSLPVIAVNRVGFESDENGGGIRFWGNSFVFDAQGVELFRSNSTDEIVQIVDIDMQKCEQVRRWWPFLRDRRIEAYSDITKRFID
jgi:N-carbamoylputrescine amidase